MPSPGETATGARRRQRPAGAPAADLRRPDGQLGMLATARKEEIGAAGPAGRVAESVHVTAQCQAGEGREPSEVGRERRRAASQKFGRGGLLVPKGRTRGGGLAVLFS